MSNVIPPLDPAACRKALALIAQDMAGAGDFPENHGAAVRQIAEIVHSLCQRVELFEQQVYAVMEQQGLQTGKLHRIADSLASIAYETSERLPVDGRDWLDPARDQVPSSQRFPSADELRPYAGRWVAVVAGKVIWSTQTLPALIGHLEREHITADSTFLVPAVASVDADQAVTQ